jgi:hypothetical protein
MIKPDEIGQFVEDILRDEFDSQGLSYNGAAFTAINLMIQHWVNTGILDDGSLEIQDYTETV